MANLPSIAILPDQAGFLLRLEVEGEVVRRALVSRVYTTPGPRGQLLQEEVWLPVVHVHVHGAASLRAGARAWTRRQVRQLISMPSSTGNAMVTYPCAGSRT